MSIKAVIFDLDDTLYPEKEYVKSGYRAVAMHLLENDRRFLPYVGGDRIYKTMNELFQEDSKNVFNRLYDHFHIPYEKADIMDLVGVYRGHMPTISFSDDVLPTLAFLAKQNLHTGILSDGFYEAQEKKGAALDLHRLFEAVFFTGKYGEEFMKPSLKGFEVLAQAFGIETSEMMYIGDNPKKDFAMDKAAGITTVRIMRPGSVYENEPYGNDFREDYRINTLTEIPELPVFG